MKTGIDISVYQENLDLSKVKEYEVSFVIIKILNNRHADRCFEKFYAAARAAGLPVGVYIYSYATTERQAREDADAVAMLLDGRPAELGVYIDIEEREQLTLPAGQMNAMVRSFAEVIRENGYTPGVYGSADTLWHVPREFGDVLVWMASYGKRPSMECDIWQWTDKGSITGYADDVDMDEAVSVRFKQLIGADPGTDTPELEEDEGEGERAFDLAGVPALRYGDRGDAVKVLQGELIARGYRCGGSTINGAEKPDGIFGVVTKASVCSFQSAHNIRPCGVVGKHTRAALIGAGVEK